METMHTGHPLVFKYIDCKCNNKCKQLNESIRQLEYDNYWNLANRDKQTAYLQSCMTIVSDLIELQLLFINIYLLVAINLVS